MLVSVVGCGHLGAAHAAAMAEIGHDVVGVDTDPEKIRVLSQGRAWFVEDGLDECLTRHVKSGRLRFTTDPGEAAEAQVHFVGVGTPTGADGMSYDMSQVMSAVRGLAPHLRRPTLLVGKSTVTVGTTAAVTDAVQSLAPAGQSVKVAWNPEFLREGHAVMDTLRPDRIVVGVQDSESADLLRELYGPILEATGARFIVTNPATCELVKGAANAFLATKMSFINSMAEVCEAAGADVAALADAIGEDPRIGHASMYPGLGFGGGCLPKDIRAFGAKATDLGAEEAAELLAVVDRINTGRRSRVVDLAAAAVGGDLEGARIALWGAAFKPGTDDVRDSPALDVGVQLRRAGAEVAVFDPQAMASAKSVAPELTYAATLEDSLVDADVVVLATEWSAFTGADPAALADLPAARVLVDARNVVDRDRWRAAGWVVLGVGRV